MSTRSLEAALKLIDRNHSHVSIGRYEKGTRPIPADYLTGIYVILWARENIRLNPAWLLLGREPIEEIDPTAAEEFMAEVESILEHAKMRSRAQAPTSLSGADVNSLAEDTPAELPEEAEERKRRERRRKEKGA